MNYKTEIYRNVRERRVVVPLTLLFLLFQLYLMAVAFNTEGIAGVATSLIGPYFGFVLLIALLTDTVRTPMFDLVATAGFTVCAGLAYLVSPSVGHTLLIGLSILCTGYCLIRLRTGSV